MTILEVASFLAAPLGPTLLAELGARVIKVEPLEGDPFRKVGLEFVHVVHGKESIAIDLKIGQRFGSDLQMTSVSAFVVASDTCPSRPQAVRVYKAKLCGGQHPGSARILGMNRLAAT